MLHVYGFSKVQRASGRARLERLVGRRRSSGSDVLYKFFLGTVNQSAVMAVVIVGRWWLLCRFIW